MIKITLEYQIDKREAITGLVYTSSPKDNKIDENSGEEIESYWLEAGLKSKQLLREIYTEVTIQDVALKVEVGLREHIKELFSNEFRTEMIMMAKFNSSDRNERKKAIFYREHHSPKFQGNIFKVIDELQEIMQPKRFRQFLSLEDGNFRFKGCERGMSLGDPIGPIYLPAFMDVFSATDLTLEEPAKSDNLIYKKGQFQKKVEKVLKDSIESKKKANRAY